MTRAELDAIIAAAVSGKPVAGEPLWSSEQVAIFQWFFEGAGNLVVQARAGTGKTTTIKRAFGFAPEDDILYVVFNKKNQREAKAKITDQRVDVLTLNSLGYRFCLRVWSGIKPDDSVELDRVKAVVGDIRDDVVDAILKLVGFAKNLYIWPSQGQLEQLAEERDIFADSDEDEDDADAWTVARVAAAALKAMELAKTRDVQGRISFNDQVWLAVAMNWVRPNYDLVVVDETQDMNYPQLVMVRKACRKSGRVCVIGDDRQAIYGFRGAAQDGMDMMRRELNAATLGLTVTYRCPKLVVAEANAIVPDYKAAATAPEGLIDSCTQVELVEQAKVGDAILSRVNAPLMSACLQLLKRGVPARIEGRDIGRQLAGIVKKLNAKSVPDFMRRLDRWETKQLARLKNAKNAEAKCAAVRDTRETLEVLAEGAASVSEIVNRLLSLFSNSDDENIKPSVVLSSVHKAKGLEWDRVFILNWTFARRKCKTEAEAKEEANIKYVAITRAKAHLTKVSEGGEPKAVKDQGDGTKAGAV